MREGGKQMPGARTLAANRSKITGPALANRATLAALVFAAVVHHLAVFAADAAGGQPGAAACSVLADARLEEPVRRIVEEYYDLSVFPYPDDWADPELFEFVTDDTIVE